jgi:16S rRNA (uracil1498-N3)-methyltransferase
MRLHRFFADQPLPAGREAMIVNPGILHQWKRVFRLGKGDSIILFNGNGMEYISRIVSLGKNEGIVYVAEERPVAFAPRRELWLFAALVKKDNFEWILQKGTELGVSHFVPLLTDRSEKKDFNSERLKKILIEAAEQSGRATIPELHALIAPERAIEQHLMPSIIFHLEGGAFVRENWDYPQLGAYLGPEGGWSDRELEFFRAKKLPIVSLGSQTLRAETAAIAVSSLLLL